MSENTMAENDNKELTAAIKKALAESKGVYLHKFKKPFIWLNEELESMAFDFESLTGRDMQAIEREMALLGTSVLVPTMSGEFLLRMASRAAGIGYDAILAMPISDAAAIRTKARNFLLKSEL